MSSAVWQNGSVLVDDEWSHGAGDEVVEVVNPATEDVIVSLPGASGAQVSGAIAAVRQAFDHGPWPRMTPGERGAVLHRWADLIERDRKPLADLLVEEVGTPVTFALHMQMGLAVEQARWLADAAARGPRGGWQRGMPPHHQPVLTTSLLVQEPIGVVAAITAFNLPVIMFVTKVFTALAAGCTTVVTPSPKTPLSTLAVTALGLEAGVPPGVVNVLVGGPSVGRGLTEHPDVDLVSFTGSVEVGRQIMAQASGTCKKVVLELGGKSPNIVLPGASIAEILPQSIMRFTRNAGQGCTATTRIILPRDRYDEYVEGAREFVQKINVGDPTDTGTDVGPLIRGSQRQRVEGYIARALDAGGVLEAGGGRPDLPKGYYLNPTIIGGLDNDAELCQEELFAPVAAVLPYDEVAEAVAIANATRFGLNANIFGPADEALEVAGRIRSGMVTINGGGGARPDAPYGGYRQSGLGREMGEEGLLEMFELKHIQWPISGMGQAPGTRK